MARLKKKKNQKQNFIGLRASDEEKNKMQIKANLYTDGNLSEWIIYSGINYSPKRDELEDS